LLDSKIGEKQSVKLSRVLGWSKRAQNAERFNAGAFTDERWAEARPFREIGRVAFVPLNEACGPGGACSGALAFPGSYEISRN
jgi:hypothetical protein